VKGNAVYLSMAVATRGDTVQVSTALLVRCVMCRRLLISLGARFSIVLHCQILL
jgi:hypothetical protein